MAGTGETSTETVAVDAPPTTPKPADEKTPETERTQSPVLQLLDKTSPSAPLPQPVKVGQEPETSGPKQETARVQVLSDPSPSVREIKHRPVVPADVAPAEKKSMFLWWILLGMSALILIIQIWTYFS